MREPSLDPVLGIKDGTGGEVISQSLLDLLTSNEGKPNSFKLAYDNQDSIIDKMLAVATRVYYANDVEISSTAPNKICRLKK